MNQINSESLNIVEENITKLKELFPEVISDKKINYEKLKQILGENIENSNEVYQFTWNGKSDALYASQTTSTGTLLPCKEESVNWEETKNIYIEGDNLEVLKLLQRSYTRKIQMIYIDPPYNTGGDFIYKDDYRDNIKNYKEQTSQENKAKGENEGRFHTNWLNMMYPRIRLAKNLLTKDGIMCISIDEHEINNLITIIRELFGDDNFDTLVWRKNGKQSNTKKINRFKNTHEYVVVAYRDKKNTFLSKMKIMPNWKGTSNPDNDPRGEWMSGNISKDDNKSRTTSENYYSVTTPSGKVITREWFIPKEEYESLANDIMINSKGEKVSRIHYPADGNGIPRIKRFKNEMQEFYFDSIIDDLGTFTDAHEELKEIFDGKDLFATPKPVSLIKELIRVSTKPGDIVLDFFSGSATTGHAVLELNTEEENRNYIMVQLPEQLDKKDEGYEEGYRTICDIGKERLKRAGKKLKKENPDKDIDIGFKVFKLDSSNIKVWDGNFEGVDEANRYFFEHIDPIVEGRTNEDILYEIIIKEGLKLNLEVEKLEQKEMYSVGDKYMVVCLEDIITSDLISEIGKLKPQTIVFKDKSFVDENLKIKTIEELKKYGIDKEKIKTI